MVSRLMIIDVVNIAFEAGSLIRDFFKSFAFFQKTDGGYLTQADLTSHKHIVSALLKLAPDVPILSEESL